jgi:hypothetical protein
MSIGAVGREGRNPHRTMGYLTCYRGDQHFVTTFSLRFLAM